MPEVAQGVEFDKVAREWRCKWSPDADKASLVKCQKLLDATMAELKQNPGIITVQRVVCGGCHDFKIITQLDAQSFGTWEGRKFSPENKFLEALRDIEGVSSVETQTYTLMPM